MSATEKVTALLALIDDFETKEDEKVCMKWSADDVQLYDTFIFDCDGVIWLDSTAIAGAQQVLTELVSLKKEIIFLSNNSTKDIAMYINKFQSLFGLTVEADQIFTSATATASYLTFILPKIQKYLKEVKILLIGSQGLYNILQNEIVSRHHQNVSIVWTRKDIPNWDEMSVADLIEMDLDPNIAVVIAGWDHFYGYKDISLLCRYLNEMEHEMHLVGTNDDRTFPAKESVLLAGTGSMLAAINAVSPIQMEVCGKPHKLLFHLIQQKYPQIDVHKCLLLGDRLNTDIAFGINCGIKTALVMTGITTPTILEDSKIKPTFVLQSIRDLLS